MQSIQILAFYSSFLHFQMASFSNAELNSVILHFQYEKKWWDEKSSLLIWVEIDLRHIFLRFKGNSMLDQ